MDNQEQSIWGQAVSEAPSTARAQFIRNTYSHLAIALLSFVLLEYVLLQIDVVVEMMLGIFTMRFGMLIFFFGFMGVSYWSQNMAFKATDKGTQYLGLSIYIIAEAFFFVPILMIAAINYPGAIQQAAIATSGLFAGLTAVVFTTKKDFSFLRSILTIAFPVMLVLMLIAFFIPGSGMSLLIAGAMVILVSGSILYQTSQIMKTHHTEQHVAAALGLFASFMTLFFYILRLFMNRN